MFILNEHPQSIPDETIEGNDVVMSNNMKNVTSDIEIETSQLLLALRFFRIISETFYSESLDKFKNKAIPTSDGSDTKSFSVYSGYIYLHLLSCLYISVLDDGIDTGNVKFQHLSKSLFREGNVGGKSFQECFLTLDQLEGVRQRLGSSNQSPNVQSMLLDNKSICDLLCEFLKFSKVTTVMAYYVSYISFIDCETSFHQKDLSHRKLRTL
jgi:hypothetical protein